MHVHFYQRSPAPPANQLLLALPHLATSHCCCFGHRFTIYQIFEDLDLDSLAAATLRRISRHTPLKLGSAYSGARGPGDHTRVECRLTTTDQPASAASLRLHGWPLASGPKQQISSARLVAPLCSLDITSTKLTHLPPSGASRSFLQSDHEPTQCFSRRSNST